MSKEKVKHVLLSPQKDKCSSLIEKLELLTLCRGKGGEGGKHLLAIRGHGGEGYRYPPPEE